ncbi:MAG: hypothetical protein LBT79_00780, partial [Elusimicrobiota bacterium]|nr:hypothetical protein [Elusimicrobiota bacterium]
MFFNGYLFCQDGNYVFRIGRWQKLNITTSVKVQTHIGLFCRQNRGKTLKFSRNRKNGFYIQKSMRFIK